MGVVNVKSGLITNRDATPPVLNKSCNERARGLHSVGVAAVGAADSIASIYRMVPVRSSDRVNSVLVSCTAIATAPAADIGLYDTTANGGAVVDVDFFATAVLLSSALSRVDVTHEAAAGASYLISQRELRLWEALGLTADPMKDYDICMTLTVAATAVGTVALDVTVCGGP